MISLDTFSSLFHFQSDGKELKNFQIRIPKVKHYIYNFSRKEVKK